MATRDVRLGRLQFATVTDDLKESLGDDLEAIGAAVMAAERRARPFSLNLPLHGISTDEDPYEAAKRTRRQLRSLLENTRARMEGLYFAFAVDPEINGWLLVGTGEIEEAAPGAGITSGEWKAVLSSCYRVANPRTHRPARHLRAVDRRLSTTARDYRGTFYSTDFASQPATVEHVLPVGIADPQGLDTRIVTTTNRTTRDGNLAVVTGASAGEVISFEQPEVHHNKADVVILDRRGEV